MEDQARLGLQAQLLDITHEAVIAFDVDERIIYWNRGAERTYGWSEREALGKAVEEVLRPVREKHGRRSASRCSGAGRR